MRVFLATILLLGLGQVKAQDIYSDLADLMNEARKSMQEADKVFEEVRRGSFGSSFSTGPVVKYKHIRKNDGHAVEFVLPKDPKAELNIDIQDHYIIVKITTVGKYSKSERSTMVQLPNGLDTEKPKIEQGEGRLLVSFKRKIENAI